MRRSALFCSSKSGPTLGEAGSCSLAVVWLPVCSAVVTPNSSKTASQLVHWFLESSWHPLSKPREHFCAPDQRMNAANMWSFKKPGSLDSGGSSSPLLSFSLALFYAYNKELLSLVPVHHLPHRNPTDFTTFSSFSSSWTREL